MKGEIERYIISILVASLAAVLWYLLLETRQDMATLSTRLNGLQNELGILTNQVSNNTREIKDDRDDMRTCRFSWCLKH